jgi:hypothetical protein
VAGQKEKQIRCETAASFSPREQHESRRLATGESAICKRTKGWNKDIFVFFRFFESNGRSSEGSVNAIAEPEEQQQAATTRGDRRNVATNGERFNGTDRFNAMDIPFMTTMTAPAATAASDGR